MNLVMNIPGPNTTKLPFLELEVECVRVVVAWTVVAAAASPEPPPLRTIQSGRPETERQEQFAAAVVALFE